LPPVAQNPLHQQAHLRIMAKMFALLQVNSRHHLRLPRRTVRKVRAPKCWMRLLISLYLAKDCTKWVVSDAFSWKNDMRFEFKFVNGWICLFFSCKPLTLSKSLSFVNRSNSWASYWWGSFWKIAGLASDWRAFQANYCTL
jgi:hypothetical protein